MPQIDSNRQPIMYRVATDLNGSPLLDSDGSLLELVVEAKQPEKLSREKKTRRLSQTKKSKSPIRKIANALFSE